MRDPLEGVPDPAPATPVAAQDPAKARFLVLQALRFTGVVLAILGALIVSGRIDLPREAGLMLILVGAADALFVPIFLARKWKTKRQP
jgi:hypothetical protein